MRVQWRPLEEEALESGGLFAVGISIHSVGISFVESLSDSLPRELAYFSIHQVQAEVRRTAARESVRITL